MADMLLNLGIDRTGVPLQEIPENTFFESEGIVYFRADDGVVYTVKSENVFMTGGQNQVTEVSPEDVNLPIPLLATTSPYTIFDASNDLSGQHPLQVLAGFAASYNQSAYLAANFPSNNTIVLQFAKDSSFATPINLSVNSSVTVTGETIEFVDMNSDFAQTDYNTEIARFTTLQSLGGSTPTFSNLQAKISCYMSDLCNVDVELADCDYIYMRACLVDITTHKRSQYSNVVTIQTTASASSTAPWLPIGVPFMAAPQKETRVVFDFYNTTEDPLALAGNFDKPKVYTAGCQVGSNGLYSTTALVDIAFYIESQFHTDLETQLGGLDTPEIAWYDPLRPDVSSPGWISCSTEWAETFQETNSATKKWLVSIPLSSSTLASIWADAPAFQTGEDLYRDLYLKVKLSKDGNVWYFFGGEQISAKIRLTRFQPALFGFG